MDDEGRPGKDLPDHLSLHSDPSAVDNPNGFETQPVNLFEIGLHHGLHVTRRKGVKIENVRDRDLDRLFLLHATALSVGELRT
jgi:hypothetical protein